MKNFFSKISFRAKIILIIILGLFLLFAGMYYFSGPKTFSWMGEASPLGVLLEDVTSNVHPPEIVEYAYLSGVIGLPIQDSNNQWIVPVYYGKHPNTGKRMVIPWLYGPSERPMTLTKAKVLDFDPTVDISASDFDETLDFEEGEGPYDEYIPVDTDMAVGNFVESLKNNWMYPMRLIVKIDENPDGCPASNEGCLRQLEFLEQRQEEARHNAEIVSYLKGERDELPTDAGFFLTPKFYETPRYDKPLLRLFSKKLIPDANALAIICTGTYHPQQGSYSQTYTCPRSSWSSVVRVPPYTEEVCVTTYLNFGGFLRIPVETCTQRNVYNYTRVGGIAAACVSTGSVSGGGPCTKPSTSGTCTATQYRQTCAITSFGTVQNCSIRTVPTGLSCNSSSPPPGSGSEPPPVVSPVVPPVVPPVITTPECTTDADCEDPLVCTDGTCSTPATPPPPTTECNDGDDNDGDTLIDTDDPDCHTDGNAGNASSYNPGDNNEAPNEPSPVVWIDATPKVVVSGGTSLLDWGVTNLGDIASITCTSDSDPDQLDWIDNATTTTEGPKTISPTGIGVTEYKITCINSESESGSASVEVLILFGSIKEVNPF